MAIDIQVQTQEAQGNVGALNATIDQLRTNLRDAYNEAKSLDSAFSFEEGAAAQLRAMREEMQQFTSSMQKMREEMDAMNTTSNTIIQSVQNQSKAFLGNVQALQQNQAAMQNAQQANTQMSNATASNSQAQKDLAAAMGRLKPLLEQDQTAMQIYTARLADLTLARKAFTDNYGVSGLNVSQFEQGLRSARAELQTNLAATTAAAQGIKTLSSELNVGQQGAAAFRAALEGTGQGFGVFSGATILAATAAFALSAALKNTIESGTDYENTLKRGAVLSGDFTTSVDSMGKAVTNVGSMTKLLADQAQELATTTKFSSQEFLEGAAKLEQASVSVVDTYNTLKPAADLATVANSTLEESISSLITVSHLFNVSFQDSAHTADILAVAATSAQTKLETLTKGLTTVGPIAREAGISLEQVTAALATLARGGFEDKAGTGIRAVLSAIGKETPAAKAALDSLGLSFKQFYDKDGFNFVAMMGKIRDALEDKSVETRMNVLNALFRSQGSAAASFFLQNVDMLQEFIKKENEAAGASAALASALNNTTKVAFQQIVNEIKNIEQDAFSGIGNGLYDSLKEFTDYLKSNAPAISHDLATIAQSILGLTQFIIEHRGAILSMVEGYVTYKASIMLLGSAASIITGFQTALTGLRAAALASAEAQAAQAAATIAEAQALSIIGPSAAQAATGVAALGVAEEGAAIASASFADYAAAGLTAIGGWPVVLAAAVAALVLFGGSMFTASFDMKEFSKSFAETSNRIGDFENAMKHMAGFSADATRAMGQSIIAELSRVGAKLNETQLDILHMEGELRLLAGANLISHIIPKAVFDDLIQNINDAKGAMEALGRQKAALSAQFAEVSLQNFFRSDQVGAYTQALAKNKDEVANLRTAYQSLTNGGILGTLDAMNRMPVALANISKGAVTSRDDLAKFFAFILEQVDKINSKGGANGGKDGGDAAAALSRAKELASEMKTIVDQFDKSSGSVDAIYHNLTEISSVTKAFEANLAPVQAELNKMGYSAEQVKQALNWKEQSIVFEGLKAQLLNLSPAFKELSNTITDTSVRSVHMTQVYKLIDTTVASLTQRFPQMAGAIEAAGERIKDQAQNAADGTGRLNEKLLAMQTNAPIAFSKLLEGTDSIEGLAKSLGIVNGEMTDSQRLMLAQQVASQNYASAIKSVSTEAEKLSAFHEVLNTLVANQALTVDQASKAWKTYEESLPTGQMLKENENLQNQITLMQAGVTNLSVYNSLWKATKGDLSQVTQGMYDAAVAQAKLNEELQQVQQVQQIYKQFADNLAGVFKNVLDGTDKSFKSFFADIKNQFKQLLIDMVVAAFRNQIMFQFGFSSQGNSQGFLGAIGSGFQNIFGGGGGGQTSYGAPAPIGDSSLNFGALLQSTIGGNTGYDMSSGTGGGSYGGANLLSLIGAGKSAFGMFSGGSAAAGSGAVANGAGGFDYFDSLFGPGSSVAGTSGAPLSIAQNTAAGGINLSAGAGAGASPGFFGSGMASYGGVMGIAGGVMAGIGEYKAAGGGVGGALGGAAYGVGTAALMGAASAAMTGGIVAGMAAIPVVGWIALAAMAINMISGGKLFGTAWKPSGSTTTYDIGQTDGTLSSVTHETRQKAFFGGTAHKDVNNTIDPQAQAQAQQMFKDIEGAGLQAQQQLGVTVTSIVEGSYKELYDKKGKLTDQFSTVLGVVYHESIEDFVTREKAEQVVAAVGASVEAMGGSADEASNIAAKYRANASILSEAANTMLAAQLDIKNGQGLLQATGPGVLTKTMALVDELNQPGEALNDTYTRLVQSTALMGHVFDNLGVATDRTREDFIRFSAAVVQDLGGIAAATQAWQNFSQSVFSATQQLISPTATSNLSDAMSKIGLDVGTSLASFTAQFKANLPQMNDQQMADWIKAGSALGTINNSMEIMAGLAKGVDVSSAINSQQQLVNQLNSLISAAAAAGASQEQLAQLEQEAAQALQQQLVNFMNPIEQSLAKFTGRDYTFQLKQVNDQMTSNILQATALGASESQLADIRALAAYQEAQIIAQLQGALSDAITKLYGSVTTSKNASAQESNQAASEASANSEKARKAAQDLYNLQLEKYQAEMAMVKSITDFLQQSVIGQLSPLGWQGQLGASKDQFMEELAKAQGGDKDAMQAITQFAQTYLQQASSAYGSSAQYGQIFQFVTDALKALQQQYASAVAPVAPPSGGGGGSGHGSSSSSGSSTPVLSQQDRYQLAVQIAQQIGELGLALNVSVFDLLKQYGVSIDQLAKDMHIDVNKLDDDTITNLKVLNGGLGTNMVDLLAQLKVTPDKIGSYFKISAAQLNQGNLTGLADLAKFLGTDIFTAMNYLGANIKDVTKSLGLDINNLNADSVDKLIEIAKTLGVNTADLISALGLTYAQLATAFGIDINNFNSSMVTELVALGTKLGMNIFDMAAAIGVNISALSVSIADAITAGLKTLPDLPQSVSDGLSPFLTELENAKTPEELKKAYTDIENYLSNLPDDIKAQLTPLFASLGFTLISGTGGTTEIADNTGDTNATLGDVKGQLRDGFNGITPPLTHMRDYADAPTSAVVSGLGDNYTMLSKINDNVSSSSAKYSSASAASASSYASSSQAQQRASAALLASSADKVFTAVQAGTQTHTQQAQKNSADHITEVKKLREEIVNMKKVVAQGMAYAVKAQSETTAAVETNTQVTRKQGARPAAVK